jgi:hypothetical protein
VLVLEGVGAGLALYQSGRLVGSGQTGLVVVVIFLLSIVYGICGICGEML